MDKMAKGAALLVGPPSDDDEMEPDEDDAEGGEEEAQVAAMADYRETLKSGTDEEALASLKTLLDLIG